MKSYDIFQASFFHWQNIHVWASKTYEKTYFAMSYWISKKGSKLTILRRGISEQFLIAYDGIHMKLLNLELFISKAITFSKIFFNFYVFMIVQDLGPWPPLPLG